MAYNVIKWRCHYAGGRTTKYRATQLMDTEMARIKLILSRIMFISISSEKESQDQRFSEMSSSNIQWDNPTFTDTQYIPTFQANKFLFSQSSNIYTTISVRHGWFSRFLNT